MTYARALHTHSRTSAGSLPTRAHTRHAASSPRTGRRFRAIVRAHGGGHRRYAGAILSEMSGPDDAMRRYALGDEQAFPEVYHALLGPLTRFVRARVRGDEALAQDIVQSTFVRMHRARSRFSEGGHVLPWALIIARNLVIDAKRSAKPGLCDELADDARDNTSISLEDDHASKELTSRVMEELHNLSPDQREALWLMRVEGLSAPDAARVVGIAPTALRVRVHRATQRLRELLGMPAAQIAAAPSKETP